MTRTQTPEVVESLWLLAWRAWADSQSAAARYDYREMYAQSYLAGALFAGAVSVDANDGIMPHDLARWADDGGA